MALGKTTFLFKNKDFDGFSTSMLLSVRAKMFHVVICCKPEGFWGGIFVCIGSTGPPIHHPQGVRSLSMAGKAFLLNDGICLSENIYIYMYI